MAAAAWYLVPTTQRGARLRPGTWHYFDTDRTYPRCGTLVTRPHGEDVRTTAQMSSVWLGVAPFCRSCDRTRRPQEGR